MINNFPSELNLSTTGIDSSSCSPTESTSNIYLYYGDECALLTTGNPKPISLDANVDGISYLFDLSVTYTYSDTPGVNIWTASGCQGDSISDYYIGTIEFSTTS
jgi:hypothetical protein